MLIKIRHQFAQLLTAVSLLHSMQPLASATPSPVLDTNFPISAAFTAQGFDQSAAIREIKLIFVKLYGRSYLSAHMPLCAENAPSANTAINFFALDSSLSDVRIRIQKSAAANAFALPSPSSAGPAEIVLTSALLELLRDPSELAFVIAHEMAHIRQKHLAANFPDMLLTISQRMRIDEVHRGWELEADLEAMKLLEKANLNSSSAFAVLERLAQFETELPDSPSAGHPETTARLSYLREHA